MGAPISMDLRKRLVDAYEQGEGSIVVVAKRFHVGSATMKRLLWLKRDTGVLAPEKRATGVNTKLDDDARASLAAWVRDQPDLTREELATELVEARGILVSVVTIGRELKRLGLPGKKSPS